MLWAEAKIGKEPVSLNEPVRKKAPDRPRKVKVFGERNTGTRAVISMLQAAQGVRAVSPKDPMPDLDRLTARVEETLTRFRRTLYRDAIRDIQDSRLGGISAWKHAAPQIDSSYADKRASVLFMVRDPYSWVASLCRNPYHARAPRFDRLEDFLTFPWITLARDNVGPLLESPMLLWNAKLRAYLEFSKAAPVPSTVLHFEDFVLDPVAALGKALAQLEIRADGLAEIGASTKENGRDHAARQARYREEHWKREITPEAARLIDSFVDWDLAAEFGYGPRAGREFS